MQLIVISSSTNFENEMEIVGKLFEAGLETFHLRKPKFSTRELKKYIQQISPNFHNRIVIHSHHSLAGKFKLKGIHLTKTHLNRNLKTSLVVKWLRFRNPKLTISTSYSKLISIFEEDKRFSYVFLSPVFDSLIGKYQSGFTEHSMKKAIEKTSHKVIARGGVDIHCLPKAKELGFAGIAIYSGLWNKKNPLTEFESIIKKCYELGIPIE
ncbi:MAG: thiamine phosphate synthase [Bacteroidia bacterium]